MYFCVELKKMILLCLYLKTKYTIRKCKKAKNVNDLLKFIKFFKKM